MYNNKITYLNSACFVSEWGSSKNFKNSFLKSFFLIVSNDCHFFRVNISVEINITEKRINSLLTVQETFCSLLLLNEAKLLCLRAEHWLGNVMWFGHNKTVGNFRFKSISIHNNVKSAHNVGFKFSWNICTVKCCFVGSFCGWFFSSKLPYILS